MLHRLMFAAIALLIGTPALRASADEPANLAAHASPHAGAFTMGSWTFQAYGSGTVLDSEKGHEYAAHTGVGYFFADGLSFNVEVLGGAVTPTRDNDGVVAGFDLLFRWHFLRDRRDGDWSIYLATGAGFQQADTNFPSDTHFNFRLNVLDLGGTLRVHDNVNLMAGVRYLHISNAHLSENNAGLDAAMPYAGVMIPF